MRRLILNALVLVAGGLAAAGCGSSTTTLTTPTLTLTTTTFSGILKNNGAANYSFNSATAGTITVTLTVGPDATLPIGLGLGTWSGSQCTVQISNEKAIQGTILTGLVSGAAPLCVHLADSAGTIVATVSYQVDVVHP